MTGVTHILVPTDGSDDACKAAGFAGDLARALGARVSVLYVQSEELIVPSAWGLGQYPTTPPSGAKSIEDIRAEIEQQVRSEDLPKTVDALGELAQEADASMAWGYPAEEISAFAAGHNVDLIVMGSHGRSALKRAFLGSVSQAVANQAPCPVTIVR